MNEMNSGKATQTPGRFLCLLVLCVVLLSLTSCDGMPIFGSSKRILFIGNSYTTTAAIPVFFQTSGNRNGWPENGLPGYENMQFEINQGYSEIAEELKAPVAPVGYAWHLAMRNNPQLNLWVDDRHPNEQGAYLAACIFYATIFRSSPEKLSYISSLPRNLAQDMQRLAAEAVLQNPSQWNL